MANDEVRLVGDFSTPDFFADEAILFDLVNDTVRLVDQLDEVRPLFDAWIAVAQAELSSRRPAPETPPEE